ncbi:MAG: hypothetical protein HY226_06305 [Candidatus Vogelbacteria bacterium]|nr:hypothetical protein [Candidatus Vogelbacteria bacterium]
MSIEDFLRGKITPVERTKQDPLTGKSEEGTDLTAEEARQASEKLVSSRGATQSGLDEKLALNKFVESRNVPSWGMQEKNDSRDRADQVAFASRVIEEEGLKSELRRQEGADRADATKEGQDLINRRLSEEASKRIEKLRRDKSR